MIKQEPISKYIPLTFHFLYHLFLESIPGVFFFFFVPEKIEMEEFNTKVVLLNSKLTIEIDTNWFQLNENWVTKKLHKFCFEEFRKWIICLDQIIRSFFKILYMYVCIFIEFLTHIRIEGFGLMSHGSENHTEKTELC